MSRLVKTSSKPRKYNDWRDNIDWKAAKIYGPIVFVMVIISISIGVLS